MNDMKRQVKGKPTFPLGQTVMTCGVDQQIPLHEVHEALERHQKGDWGQVCPDDWSENDQALTAGTRLLSAYASKAGVKFWIITEWDRSVTTVLLPEEY